MKLDWQTLISDNGTRYPKILFFELEGAQSFRYGVDADGGYCLFFEFDFKSGGSKIDPIELAKIRLEEETIDDVPMLILTLLDPGLLNQFSDLIINIVSEVLKEEEDQKKKFIQICNEWFELFQPASGVLSRQELQGIYAEIVFLRYLLENSSFGFNDVLSAWKGPFGKGHDFELPNNNNFEVKSISDGTALVHISSEFQLDCFRGQRLVLIIQRFQSLPQNGNSISQLVDEVHSLLKTQVGVRMNLFWTAMSKTGLVISSLGTYDSHLFDVISTDMYECSDSSFPAIKRTGISDTIRNVRYDLALPDLTGFLLNDISDLI